MTEQARFNLQFRTTLDRPFNLSIKYPDDTVNGDTVREVMDEIINLDMFLNATGSLSKAVGASITDVTYKEIDIS